MLNGGVKGTNSAARRMPAIGSPGFASSAPISSGGSAKVGVTGSCMGGALTILALTMAPEADAGVTFYGLPPLEFIDTATANDAQRPEQAWALFCHSLLASNEFMYVR